MAVLHDPTTYGEGGVYGIKQVYDKAGQKTEDQPGHHRELVHRATAGLMPQVNAVKAAGVKCVDVWLTPQDQAAFAQDAPFGSATAITQFGNDETNADDTFANLAGEHADGTISAVLTSDLHPSAEMQAFRDDYKKKFNSSRRRSPRPATTAS